MMLSFLVLARIVAPIVKGSKPPDPSVRCSQSGVSIFITFGNVSCSASKDVIQVEQTTNDLALRDFIAPDRASKKYQETK